MKSVETKHLRGNQEKIDSRRQTRGSSSRAQRDQPQPPQAPPQQPGAGNIFNEVMFENFEQQAWYDANFLTKTIISERPVIYEDFENIGVRQILADRGWLHYVRFIAPAYDCLVCEFYSNAEIIGERQLRVFVRGIVFQVTPATIAEFFQPMQRPENPQYPYNELPYITTIGRELTGNPEFVWGRPNKYIK